MHKEKDLQRIVDCGVVAIVRFHHSQELVGAAQARKATAMKTTIVKKPNVANLLRLNRRTARAS